MCNNCAVIRVQMRLDLLKDVNIKLCSKLSTDEALELIELKKRLIEELEL